MITMEEMIQKLIPPAKRPDLCLELNKIMVKRAYHFKFQIWDSQCLNPVKTHAHTFVKN